jgi:Mn2+/Fe2+ NRAMP family transporter
MSQAQLPEDGSAPDDSGRQVQEPPIDVRGIVLRLGPGLIIAGSIVGSGELIATTKTGAEAGFWLLWLIIIGCVIKVFVQVELGRDAVCTGKTTMDALSEVPGPRVRGRGNWLIWYYFVMFAASVAQLGGIVGGVGQAMAISMPLTERGRTYNSYVGLETRLAVTRAELRRAERQIADSAEPTSTAATTSLRDEAERMASDLASRGDKPQPSADDKIWAGIIAVATAGLLMVGRYKLIEVVTTAMVAMFTFATVANVLALQWTDTWAITLRDLANGLSFRLPPETSAAKGSAVGTALKTFGVIGVGATELIAYPYWCLEKGYARFTGPRDETAGWDQRARGWMNVMRWDAWCSMFIYTIATLAFYLLGAAILFRTQLNPTGNDLIRTLAVMYEPVFGAWAPLLFLVGAFAVLYSTFFVAIAGHARVVSDGLRVLGLGAHTPEAHKRRVRWLSGGLPFICLVIYIVSPVPPDQLVLISGMMQALMLPMLSGAALYFRYRKCDPRIQPGRLWDAFLWLSALGMLIAGSWLAYSEIARFF